MVQYSARGSIESALNRHFFVIFNKYYVMFFKFTHLIHMPFNHRLSLARQAALFLLIFAGLQWLWGWQRDSQFALFLIEGLTIHLAVGAIHLISPEAMAVAKGIQISAIGGGINVYSGCEGVEIMFMLITAILIAPAKPVAKLSGMALGCLYVFFLNQIRLIVLFYVLRINKSWFELAHGTLFPIFLVALTALYFGLWLSRNATYTSTTA